MYRYREHSLSVFEMQFFSSYPAEIEHFLVKSLQSSCQIPVLNLTLSCYIFSRLGQQSIVNCHHLEVFISDIFIEGY